MYLFKKDYKVENIKQLNDYISSSANTIACFNDNTNNIVSNSIYDIIISSYGKDLILDDKKYIIEIINFIISDICTYNTITHKIKTNNCRPNDILKTLDDDSIKNILNENKYNFNIKSLFNKCKENSIIFLINAINSINKNKIIDVITKTRFTITKIFNIDALTYSKDKYIRLNEKSINQLCLNELFNIITILKVLSLRYLLLYKNKNITNYICDINQEKKDQYCRDNNCNFIYKDSKLCIIGINVLEQKKLYSVINYDENKSDENELINDIIQYTNNYCKYSIKNKSKFRKYVNSCAIRKEDVDPRIFYLFDNEEDIDNFYKKIKNIESKKKGFFSSNPLNYIKTVFKQLLEYNNKNKITEILNELYYDRVDKIDNKYEFISSIYNIFYSDIQISYAFFKMLKDRTDLKFIKNKDSNKKKTLILNIIKIEIDTYDIVHKNNLLELVKQDKQINLLDKYNTDKNTFIDNMKTFLYQKLNQDISYFEKYLKNSKEINTTINEYIK